MELVLAFHLSSIRSDKHLELALEGIDRLLAKSELDDGEEMYLDALSDLVATYEDEHHAIEPASDADMLRHLIEARDITQTQLSLEAFADSRHRAGEQSFDSQSLVLLIEG
jgi:HTH-type transcriptional regulator/antitoxin HigA